MKDKIIEREAAVALRETYRARGKRVGFTSGVFDILHPGHVEYLESARGLVDVLFVGINSDASVKANKGEFRPICSEGERAETLAGLAAVDHVFIFSERNNNQNVELLRPDLYLKAGDYSAEKLTSKSIVESYGGRVELVPFKGGHSTTSIIDRIKLASISDGGQEIKHQPRPAIFLDRDGTINEHIEYLSEPEKFKEIPGSFAAMRKFQELGYRIIIITNQPGIGLGYFTREDLYAVNREMMIRASKHGVSIDKIYYCPHSKADGCQCRKPGTYFIKRAESELAVDLSRSVVVGDMTSDIKLGRDAGCRTALVRTGRGGADGLYQVEAEYVADDLGGVLEWVQGTQFG
jgi:rfaE bifunctional protein nucleotidyltransferase chain/domain